jgi:hypothetical protein
LAALVLLVPLNHLRQLVARQMAEVYNRNVPPPPKAVQFLEAFLLKCLDIQGQPVVGVEECVLPLPLLPSLSLTPPLPPFRYVAGEYKKYNNNWDWAEDKRCFPTLTISSRSLSSHLHAPPNTSLPQQYASSFQPLDPDLLSRQAAHMRYSSAFSSSITCADCCRLWFCFVTVFTLCRV